MSAKFEPVAQALGISTILRGFHVKETGYGYIDVQQMGDSEDWHICRTPLDDPFTYDRGWCYTGTGFQTFVRAVLAAIAWDGADDTEPAGYDKSLQTGGLQGMTRAICGQAESATIVAIFALATIFAWGLGAASGALFMMGRFARRIERLRETSDDLERSELQLQLRVKTQAATIAGYTGQCTQALGCPIARTIRGAAPHKEPES